MHLGTQLHAPHGLGSLAKGIRYYYAGRRNDGRVLLVWFAKSKKLWRTYCIRLSAEEFENALGSEKRTLKIFDPQLTCPEWLSEVDGVNFDDREDLRYKNKTQTYRRQVENRFEKVGLLLEHEQEILSAENPLKTIAKIGDSFKDAVHPHRLQRWFFSYILHSRDIWSLKQPTHKLGQWDRDSKKHRNTLFGRRSLDDGQAFGWPSVPLRERILDSYLSQSEFGVTMRKIHRTALIEDFGCEVCKDENGNPRFFHPDNAPFPSYGQFRFVVVKTFGLEAVQTTKLGAPRMRAHAVVEDGNFTQQYSNIMECVEVDAFRVAERPRAMYSHEAMPALVVARGVCVTTGAVIGVGFSLGGETGDAYRSMLFSMAVPKSLVARLYGIPIEHLHWIMSGIPASFLSDRGPGGSPKLVERLELQFPVKTIVISYGGQSKAVVESSQPKNVQQEGAPSFVLSDLDVIQMMKREVLRAAADNRSSDISARLSDEAIHEFRRRGWAATPEQYWKYLEERLRTSGHSMSVEQAVRAFCKPIELKIDRVGAKYRNRWYTSQAFKSTGIQESHSELQDFRLKGYVVDMVVRYIWVEVKGRLIELEATKRVRIDDEDLLVPLSQLEETAKQLAVLKSKTRNINQAAAAQAEISFQAITGKSWHQGERRAGSPKKGRGTTAHEAKVVRGTPQGRKAA